MAFDGFKRAMKWRAEQRTVWVTIAVLGLIACATQGNTSSGPKQRRADEVLLVGNSDSPISRAVADDYAEKRRIRNRVWVHCPDAATSTRNETIAIADFSKRIENPIRTYLAAHPGIEFIVLTKGIPLRIIGASLGSCDEHSTEPVATRGHPSVDSYLSALDYGKLPGLRRISITGSGAIGAAYANRYWNTSEPFSHRKFGGYLVSRLDGYTESDAKGLVRRALEAESISGHLIRIGEVLLDCQPQFGMGDKFTQPAAIHETVIPAESGYDTFNADMRHAHDRLTDLGVRDELNATETFVGGRKNLIGYFSWGSNDARLSPPAYQSLRFLPGSLSDTAVSTSARTFLPTQGGQSLLVDLIAHGLTCGKGYSDEPLLQAIASPTIALNHYFSGYTMVESFYAASQFVGWEDIVVGDPLCCPFHQRG